MSIALRRRADYGAWATSIGAIDSFRADKFETGREMISRTRPTFASISFTCRELNACQSDICTHNSHFYIDCYNSM